MSPTRRNRRGPLWAAALLALAIGLGIAAYLGLRPRPAAIDRAAVDQEPPPGASLRQPLPPPAGQAPPAREQRPPAASPPAAAPPALPPPAAGGKQATASNGGQPPPPIAAPPTIAPRTEKERCAALARQVAAIFTYLDGQGYGNEYAFSRPQARVFADLARRLFASPPVIVHEDRDLFTVARNTAHLYRVLGAKNIFFLRHLLQEERGRIEHDLKILLPFALNGCQVEGFSLPFDKVYEYAAFFLTTVGGRSYLFRRDPDLRFLGRYYSILVVDAANERVKNKYGIDLLPLIQEARADLAAATGLVDRDTYAATLDRLEATYRAQARPSRF